MSARVSKHFDIDPEPVRFPIGYGLCALLYFRVPSKPEPDEPEDPWAAMTLDDEGVA